MFSTLSKILKDIERDTGISAVVFSEQGVILSASCEEDVPAFPVMGVADTAFSQGGFYFYPVKNNSGDYVIAVVDCADAKTHAVLISHAIAGKLVNIEGETAIDLIKLILSGNADAADTRRLREKFGYPEGKYFVMAASTYKNSDGIRSVLSVLSDSKYDGIVETEGGFLAFIKHVNSDSEVNPMEFAISVAESVFAETGVRISVCVGDVVSNLGLISGSYFSAMIGLKTAFRMNYAKNVFSYRDFVVMDLLTSIPGDDLESHRKSLIKPAFISVIEDQELSETAEAFFNCSLNVSETARSLFIHRNTLMYRLNKIERETGLNIRSFSDALAFRVMQMLYKTIDREE